MTARTVFVTADDFGLSPGVNRGIWEAFERGTVHRVSMIADGPGWSDAVERLHASDRRPRVGLHFNLTIGEPRTRARSLRARNGKFFSLRALATRAVLGRIDPSEVEAECRAQLERIAEAGVTVEHLDGHQHVHVLPRIRPAVMRVAAAFGLDRVRVPHEPLTARDGLRLALKKLALQAASRDGRRRDRHFRGLGVSRRPETLFAILADVPVGETEILVHPGYVDDALRACDPYWDGRENELRALMDARVRDLLLPFSP